MCSAGRAFRSLTWRKCQGEQRRKGYSSAGCAGARRFASVALLGGGGSGCWDRRGFRSCAGHVSAAVGPECLSSALPACTAHETSSLPRCVPCWPHRDSCGCSLAGAGLPAAPLLVQFLGLFWQPRCAAGRPRCRADSSLTSVSGLGETLSAVPSPAE